jgi:pyruvate ferredoxin oxidoreductase delta subunit
MKKKSLKKMPIGGCIIEAGNSINYKTGDWKTFRPVRDKKKCTNCLLCFVFCPENCIKVKKGQIQDADLDYCKGCGICAEECPVKAISMQKEECQV